MCIKNYTPFSKYKKNYTAIFTGIKKIKLQKPKNKVFYTPTKTKKKTLEVGGWDKFKNHKNLYR